MNMPRLVSFSGYATCGKDAAADLLVANDGYVKTYMSKPLEKALLMLDPIIFDGYWGRLPERYSIIHETIGYDESKKIPEVRRMLQMLGTEIGRNMFGENAWVDLAFDDIIRLSKNDQNVVITGVRYPNEIEMINSFGSGWHIASVWINRPGVEPVNSHSSDNTLTPEDCDYVVENDGTLEDLYVNVMAALNAESWLDKMKPIGQIITIDAGEAGLEVEYELYPCVYDQQGYVYICTTHNEVVRIGAPNSFDPVRVACPKDPNRPKG